MMDAQYWIDKLDLQKHPEGGYYKEMYRSGEIIDRSGLPERFPGPRVISTSIYFLLPGGESSHLHRIKSDELWHFYSGSSLTIHTISERGTCLDLKLGPEVQKGQGFQAVVPAGCWFGAVVDDPQSFTLVGCTVAPGFDFGDFEMGSRKALLESYPKHRLMIERLTKPDENG